MADKEIVEKGIEALKKGMIAKEKSIKVGTTFLMPETVELEIDENLCDGLNEYARGNAEAAAEQETKETVVWESEPGAAEKIDEIQTGKAEVSQRNKPGCFGAFYTIGADVCSEACKTCVYAEECKGQSCETKDVHRIEPEDKFESMCGKIVSECSLCHHATREPYIKENHAFDCERDGKLNANYKKSEREIVPEQEATEEKITDENTLTLIALADVFEIPPMENQFDEAFKAAAKLKAEVDSGILQYPPPAKPPHEKSLVLTITTKYGKRYTCRTVEELETWIDNYKVDKKLKRDEDVGIEVGFGRMTEAEYAQVPACKYFIKPK